MPCLAWPHVNCSCAPQTISGILAPRPRIGHLQLLTLAFCKSNELHVVESVSRSSCPASSHSGEWQIWETPGRPRNRNGSLGWRGWLVNAICPPPSCDSEATRTRRNAQDLSRILWVHSNGTPTDGNPYNIILTQNFNPHLSVVERPLSHMFE